MQCPRAENTGSYSKVKVKILTWEPLPVVPSTESCLLVRLPAGLSVGVLVLGESLWTAPTARGMELQGAHATVMVRTSVMEETVRGPAQLRTPEPDSKGPQEWGQSASNGEECLA